MTSWSFLASHARVLLCIARDPGVRLRRGRPGHHRAQRYGIVTSLAAAGYVMKQEDSRRNRPRRASNQHSHLLPLSHMPFGRAVPPPGRSRGGPACVAAPGKATAQHGLAAARAGLDCLAHQFLVDRAARASALARTTSGSRGSSGRSSRHECSSRVLGGWIRMRFITHHLSQSAMWAGPLRTSLCQGEATATRRRPGLQ